MTHLLKWLHFGTYHWPHNVLKWKHVLASRTFSWICIGHEPWIKQRQCQVQYDHFLVCLRQVFNKYAYKQQRSLSLNSLMCTHACVYIPIYWVYDECVNAWCWLELRCTLPPRSLAPVWCRSQLKSSWSCDWQLNRLCTHWSTTFTLFSLTGYATHAVLECFWRLDTHQCQHSTDRM